MTSEPPASAGGICFIETQLKRPEGRPLTQTVLTRGFL